MLENTTPEERTLILIELTRRLSMYSSPEVYLKRMQSKKERSKEKQEKKIRGRERLKPKKKKLDKEELKEMDKETSPRPPKNENLGPPQKKGDLKVPEPKLPAQMSHMKPDEKNLDIDLGKLNPVIKDSAVRQIECRGPGQKIIVKGSMGTKPTNIILNQDEIEDIVNTFSEKSGTPIREGTTEISVGKFQVRVMDQQGQEGKRFTIMKAPKGGNSAGNNSSQNAPNQNNSQPKQNPQPNSQPQQNPQNKDQENIMPKK